MANVKINEEIMSGWADTIREKHGIEDSMKPSVLLEKTRELKGSADDTNILQYATFVNAALFRNAVFPENTEMQMKVKGSSYSGFTYMFFSSNIYSLKFETENPTQITANGMFQACSKLVSVYFLNEEIGFDNVNSMFDDNRRLKTVRGKINLSTAKNIGGMFYRCEALEDVEFTPLTIKLSISFAESSKLSNTSIQSIIDGLADLTGQTTQTLTLHVDVKSKLTQEQIATITSKNWTLA